MAKGGGRRTQRNSDAAAAFWFSAGHVFQALVETVGLAGTFLFLAFSFVVQYASEEQKRAIIEMYVLWRGPSRTLPLLLYSIAVVMLIFAQRHYYEKLLRDCRSEVDRIGREKSALQEKLGPSPMHHSQGKPKT